MDYSGIAVIIPVLNEEQSLPLVINSLPGVGRLVVVDNGSTDRSALIAEQLGAEVVYEPHRGYGAACLEGLNHLRTTGDRPEIVVFIDGDFSDYPEQLGGLVEPILNGEADFVLGSRLLGQREQGAMPFQSRLGNRLACFLMWCLWGASYTDLGPFRAIRWASLESLRMQDRTYGWTIEMQIKAVLSDLIILEQPVDYRQRIGHSKISGTVWGSMRAGYKILFTIGKYWWMTGCVSRSSGRNCPRISSGP